MAKEGNNELEHGKDRDLSKDTTYIKGQAEHPQREALEAEIVFDDGGWINGDGHAVTEFLANRAGPLSPFGEVEFPVKSTQLPYVHPNTIPNHS